MKFLLSILRGISHLLFRIRMHGKDKILKEGPVIVCANHISVWDPILLYLHYPREIVFLSKKELFSNPVLGWIFKQIDIIAVDREKPELSTIKDCLKTLNNNKALGIFPQGTRKKTIDEDDGKAGVGLMAYKANAPVQPLYIDASYRLFSKVNIVVGDLIYPEDDENIPSKLKYEEFGKKIMREIRKIKNESNFSWWIGVLLWR